MCKPAAALAAFQIVGGLASYNSSVSSYNAQAAANAATRRSAIQSRDLQIQQTVLRNEQEQNAVADKQFMKMVESYKKKATHKTAIGEDSIVGRTIRRSIDQRSADYLRATDKLSDAARAIQQQSLMDARGIQAQMEGRFAQTVDPVAPDPLSAIAGTAADAGSAFAAVGEDTKWGDVLKGLGF